MLRDIFVCPVCKKNISHGSDSESPGKVCPHCGSKMMKEGVLSSIIKFLCSGGG